jgi:hypothetical protein
MSEMPTTKIIEQATLRNIGCRTVYNSETVIKTVKKLIARVMGAFQVVRKTENTTSFNYKEQSWRVFINVLRRLCKVSFILSEFKEN